MIKVTAYKWVPPMVQGLVKDLRVRWALEEAGLAYETELVSLEDVKSAEYRRRQPFGQVPVFEEDGFVLFESGAIVLHIGGRSETLLPKDPAARARAQMTAFAALNSLEPWVLELATIEHFDAGAEWTQAKRPAMEQLVRDRLGGLRTWLGNKDYLEGHFTGGDLLMISVLRVLSYGDLVKADPVLGPYLARGEARPAFQRALAAQLKDFRLNAPVA